MRAIRKKIIAILTSQGMIFSWWNSLNPKDLISRTPNRPMMHHAVTVRQISYIVSCLPRVSCIAWLYHRTRRSAITEVCVQSCGCVFGVKTAIRSWSWCQDAFALLATMMFLFESAYLSVCYNSCCGYAFMSVVLKIYGSSTLLLYK